MMGESMPAQMHYVPADLSGCVPAVWLDGGEFYEKLLDSEEAGGIPVTDML
jgi:hypothetical protein